MESPLKLAQRIRREDVGNCTCVCCRLAEEVIRLDAHANKWEIATAIAAEIQRLEAQIAACGEALKDLKGKLRGWSLAR